MNLGMLALGRKRTDDAVSLLERAARIRSEDGARQDELAEVWFALARALDLRAADHGDDRVRALRLTRQAAEAYETAGAGDSPESIELRAWLQARGAASGQQI